MPETEAERAFQIQCFSCGNWHSSSEIGVPLDEFIPYMTNYEYTCSSCGTEAIAKKAASFIQVCITTLANLTAQHAADDPPRIYHSLEEEIIPFVWAHWDTICTKRSKAGNWRSNLSTKLTTETRIFCEREEGSREFGLVDQDLTTIGPRRYESKTVPTKGLGKMKRKLDSSQPTSAPKKAKSDAVPSKALSHGYPLEHPYNKDGYRYILAEKDPHSDLEVDPEAMAGQPIPPQLYRPFMSSEVLLALHDRAPQLKIGENRLTVTGEKGYCMVRGTHGVSSGTWFYEVYVDDLTSVKGCATRLGWAQSLANLQAPCGYDKLSYSIRSKYGTRFHQNRGKHYSQGYTTGNTLGFLIHLPPGHKAVSHPPTYKDKALIKFKNFFYFEEKDEAVEDYEKTLRPLHGSKIVFYKNGECQGAAWTDILAGTYYPALSFYRDATVSANFGPEFKYPPQDIQYRPMSDAADLSMVEQTMSEMLFHVQSRLNKADGH